MTRYKRFTFLCNPDERKAITELSTYLHRSQSDAVRFVVMKAVQELAEKTETQGAKDVAD